VRNSTRGLAPALPIPRICESLARVGSSERPIRAISHHIEFRSIQYRSHQICFFADLAKATLHYEASVNNLAMIFDASRWAVWKNLIRGPEDP
jgi:hypothetical protein